MLSRWDGSSALPERFAASDRFEVSLQDFWNISFQVQLSQLTTFCFGTRPNLTCWAPQCGASVSESSSSPHLSTRRISAAARFGLPVSRLGIVTVGAALLSAASQTLPGPKVRWAFSCRQTLPASRRKRARVFSSLLLRCLCCLLSPISLSLLQQVATSVAGCRTYLNSVCVPIRGFYTSLHRGSIQFL